METVRLPHLPACDLHLCLFLGVINADFLRQQLLDGNNAFEYAFVDATVILSRAHVMSACFRAINDKINHRLKTRNVHSEIVFAMSPNNNIAESFRRFGIQDDSKNIVAIKVGGERDVVESHLRESVRGEMVGLTDERLSKVHDLVRVKKVYRGDGESFVLGSMALKGS